MREDFLKLIKEAFQDPEKVEPSQMAQLVEEASYYLEKLEMILQSGSVDDKARAIQEALQIKEFLEMKTTDVAESSGMSAQEFRDSIRSPSMFENEEDRQLLEKLSKKLDKSKNNKPKLKPIPLR